MISGQSFRFCCRVPEALHPSILAACEAGGTNLGRRRVYLDTDAWLSLVRRD